MSKDTKNTTIKQDPAIHIKFLPIDIPRAAVGLIGGIIFRPKKIYISDKRPSRKGGALVIANHYSYSDPLILGISMNRRMYYLAGELAMGKGLKTLGLKGCGCIGIDRNISDLDGIKRAVNVMKRGHYLLMFPQGRLHREEEMTELKSGAILMAWQANVPILPVYVKKGDNRSAIMEFNKIIERFPKSSYVDDALLGIGNSFIAMGYKDDAKAFLEELINRHPKSPLVAEARKQLKAIGGGKR